MAFGAGILLLCPILFLAYAWMKVRRHIKSGNLTYKKNDMPNLKQLYNDIIATPGVFGKIVNARAVINSYQERGEWEDDEHSAKWAFLMGDYCGGFWLYSIWLLVKKVILSGILNMLEGQANAVGALILQCMDSGLLLFMRPFVNRQTDLSETIGTVSNLLAYLAISLPVIAPQFVFFGEFAQIASATLSTVVGAFFSMMAPVFAIIKAVGVFFAFLFQVPSRILACYAALGSGGSIFATIQEAAYGNMKDALNDELEDHYALEEEEGEGEGDGEGDENDHDDDSTGLAQGAAAIGFGSVVAGGDAAGGRQASIAQTMTLKLKTDGKGVGEESSEERNEFEADLLNDLAYASGLPQDTFCVNQVSPGGGIVEVQVEIQGQKASEAAKVVKILQDQVKKPTSRLKHGAWTSSVSCIHYEADEWARDQWPKSVVTMGTFSQQEMLGFAGGTSARKSDFEILLCKDLSKASGSSSISSPPPFPRSLSPSPLSLHLFSPDPSSLTPSLPLQDLRRRGIRLFLDLGSVLLTLTRAHCTKCPIVSGFCSHFMLRGIGCGTFRV